MPRKNTKSKNNEFRMTITPGAVPKCPHCGRENTLSIYDGDTIPMREAMPEAKVVAGGLALSKDAYCFYACLNAGVCRVCGAGCYTVDLNVAKRPEVSRDWADAYFWLNGDTEEPYFRSTVTSRGGGLPRRWTWELSKTEEGELERYSFGPFVPREALEGSNGVANCSGGKVWKHAAALIVRVWPIIVEDREWTESITVRGRWPLRHVPGWTPNGGKKIRQ